MQHPLGVRAIPRGLRSRKGAQGSPEYFLNVHKPPASRL